MVDMLTDPVGALRERGLRVTGQRIAVLKAVGEGEHLTADAVATAVRTQLGSVSLQAVYDALNTLIDVGLLRRIQPAGSPALFEARVADNHHHLICRSCGTVTDIDCSIGPAPCLAPSDHHGYAIDEAEITYWGVCPECLATASRDLHAHPTS